MAGRDVQIGDAVPAFAATPDGARRGVVVLHEIYGRAPEIDRVVERFEALGYAAVAPDLLADGLKPLCIRRAVLDLWHGEGPTLEKVRAAKAWLTQTAGVPPERIGVIGFCFGGSFAIAMGPEFGVVSTNYGAIPRDRVPAGMPPTIGCYGGRDVTMAGVPRKLAAALEAQGAPHEIVVDPTVGHSFLTDGHRPIMSAITRPLLHVGYDVRAADAGWARIRDFFDTHLPE